jgi:arylsulfatase A-like enzyme
MRSNSHEGVLPFAEEMKAAGLGHLLRRAGYETLYGGKVHLPFDTSPEEIGFQTFSTDERDDLARTAAEILRGGLRRPFAMVASFINPHDICYVALREHPGTDTMRDLVGRSHVELRTLERALADPGDVPLPPNFDPQADEPTAIRDLLGKQPWREYARSTWDESAWRRHRRAYARLTEFVDAQIGAVLAALDDAGLWDDTVVVFTSDHGDMAGAHRLEQKIVPYREAIEVPFIIADPTALGNRTDSTHLISNGLDLLPTLCDYAGARVPPFLTGSSVRPLVCGDRGEPKDWRSTLAVESLVATTTVGPTWIHSLYDEGDHREQFYDLERDPGQTSNWLSRALEAEVGD